MSELVTIIWPFIAAAIVLFLPGYTWLVLFWDPDQNFASRVADAAGISLSLTSLVGLGTFLIPIQLSAPWFAGIYLLMFCLSAWLTVRRITARRARQLRESQNSKHIPTVTASDPAGYLPTPNWKLNSLQPGLILIVFLAVLGLRFYQIRDLALPSWVDSVHHVLIVRLILETGGIPETFEPYMPVPFFYHFGFHAMAAAYTALGRLEPYLGVLQIGQVLNALVVLSIYRMGKSIWGDPRRAVLSALLVGFATQMPAYYVTWGRYTLLTGMVLLPLAMAAAMDVFKKGPELAKIANLCVLTAGLFLAHYYTAWLFVIFLIILGISAIFHDFREGRPIRGSTWLPMSAAALLGLGLAGTWIYRVLTFTQGVLDIGMLPPSTSAVEEFYFPNYLSYLWRLLGPIRNQILTLAAMPGLAILIWRPATRIFGIWCALLVISLLPWGIYLTPFRPDHAAIVLFFPVAMMASELLVTFFDWRSDSRFARVKGIATAALLMGLIVSGVWQTRSIINQSTVLATDADLRAIEWIGQNTPPNARFFINVNHWQYGIYRGSDGGWWILPLSGRETILPPALYPLGEPGFVDEVNKRAAAASQLKACSPEFWEMVQTARLTHVYVKGAQGSEQQEILQTCSGVSLLYSNEGVSIYEIVQ